MSKSCRMSKVQQVKKKIFDLEPIIPGSLSTQWNVCSTPGCKCKDKKNPKRHGPYYQLSFSIGGKSSTLFVKKGDVPEVRKRLRRYKKFKDLCRDLVKSSVDQAREKGFSEEEE